MNESGGGGLPRLNTENTRCGNTLGECFGGFPFSFMLQDADDLSGFDIVHLSTTHQPRHYEASRARKVGDYGGIKDRLFYTKPRCPRRRLPGLRRDSVVTRIWYA